MTAILDNFRLAFGTFWTNPLRSLLTLLGIVIGVATVVSMMGLIEGLRIKVTRDLTFLGANVFELSRRPSGTVNINVDWRKYARRPEMSLEEMRAIRESVTDAAHVSATQYKGQQKIASPRAETQNNVWVLGGTSEWADTNGVTVADGRFYSDMEDSDAADVAVIGWDVRDVLFPDQPAVDETIRISGRPLRVIGVFQKRGSVLGMGSQDNQVLLPLRTFQRLFGQTKYLEIDVQAKDASVFEHAQDQAIAVLRRMRGLSPSQENNFEITTNESNAQLFNNMSMVIGAAGVGICLLSLIVGGIGILNIMLVSVTERTREIGIRKALGARKRRILAQFATEAVVLSIFGGFIGIALGYAMAALAKWVAGIPTAVPPWAVLLAVAMSSATGLIFGIYPAARAAQLDPVEAMRSE